MMTARLSSWHRNEGHLRPLQAAAAQKVTAFSRSPWRFVTSAYLAGAAIAFMYLAASAVRAPLAALAPGSELLAIPLVIASGLSALVLLGRLDLSVGTGASATQVDNLFQVAAEMGQADALREAVRSRVLVASIGPISTEAVQTHDLEPDVLPEHPKMGHLVAAVARQAADLLRRKRGSSLLRT